jgi:hypothetical protein
MCIVGVHGVPHAPPPHASALLQGVYIRRWRFVEVFLVHGAYRKYLNSRWQHQFKSGGDGRCATNARYHPTAVTWTRELVLPLTNCAFGKISKNRGSWPQNRKPLPQLFFFPLKWILFTHPYTPIQLFGLPPPLKSTLNICMPLSLIFLCAWPEKWDQLDPK